MNTWTIRLTMTSPVVLSARTPLVGDALLSAAEARRRWRGQVYQRQPVPGVDWIDRLPLPVAEESGHWAVSLVAFEGLAARMTDRLYKTVDERIAAPKEQRSGALKAARQPFTAWWVPVLSFDVDVPPDQQDAFDDLVARFLPRIAVGALGRVGFGRIGHVECRPRDPAIGAVWDAAAQPRRPMRMTALPEGWVRDPERTIFLPMRPEPPRWYGPKEWCAVPHPHRWVPRLIDLAERSSDPHGDDAFTTFPDDGGHEADPSNVF